MIELEVRIERSEIEVTPSVAFNGSMLRQYVHEQLVPVLSWNIEHNLHRIPAAVTVVNSANEVVFGDVVHESPTRTVINFSAAFAGTAYLL